MTKIFKYLKNYGYQAILSPLFKLFEAILELLIPLIVATIIDKGIANNNQGFVIKMVLLMVGLGFIGLIFSILGQFFAAIASVGTATNIRHDLFKKMTNLSFSQIDKEGSSTLITRMTSDVNQVQTGINLTLRLLLRSPFVVIGAAIMAYLINPGKNSLIIIFIVTILLLSIVVAVIMSITIPLHKKSQAALDTVLTKTRENINGVRVIRAFCNEDKEIKEYNEKTSNLKRAQTKAGNISTLLNPLTYVIINIAIIILLYYGAIKVNNGVLSQGQLIALYNYLSQILVELIKFANLLINITKSIASFNRINSIITIDTREEIDKVKAINSNAYILFDHVGFSYNGAGEEVLSDISFSVNKGETIGIIGGTGSGKSTLISLLPRFYDYTSGEIYFKGRNLKSYSQDELLKMIAVVLQKAVLFKGTIRDNIKWGKNDATDEEIKTAINMAQAEDVLIKKNNDLGYQVEALGKNFSGGQRQRLAIARALVKNAEVIIFDDSSSALDYATDAKLRKALDKLQITKFIVSQRTASLMHADKIIVLDDGKISSMGTHEELLQKSPLYQDIYYSQFKKEDK